LPDRYDEVEVMFARKGAYSRYKDFLSRNECLDEWYKFEESATRELLCEWAVEEGFEVEIELRGLGNTNIPNPDEPEPNKGKPREA